MIKKIKKHLSHDTHPLIQFIKYGIVGGMATATHITTFFLLGWFFLPCLTPNDPLIRLFALSVTPITEATRLWNAGINNTIAFVISNIFCYILNRLFVFKPGRHHVIVEFFLFFAVSGISLIAGLTIQSYLIKAYAIETSIAFAANIFCSLLINYGMRKFVVFKG